MTKFSRFELRTTDVPAARAFYSSILGHERAVIWPLHEQAMLRGAKSHWLGHIEVEDLELANARFIARGATPLGPARATHDGGRAAVLRDPGGAVLALFTLPPGNVEAGVEIVWHVLNTNDVGRAKVNYGELFGWSFTGTLDSGPKAHSNNSLGRRAAKTWVCSATSQGALAYTRSGFFSSKSMRSTSRSA